MAPAQRAAALAATSIAALLLFSPHHALAQSAAALATSCERLRNLVGPDARVDAVESVPAGPLPPMFAGLPAPSGPAHCRLVATLGPRLGVKGQKFGTGFELRLPLNWNGRFLFQGGGGLDGAIRPAVGYNLSGKPSALARGFAVVSTDAGHQGPDASFASDQLARLDYAYRALGQVGERAKAITSAFYGAKPKFSYFEGCSNGGRQGMMAASRFPELFDGIVAGDPGFRLSRAAVGEMWNNAQFAKISKTDAQGRPIYSTAFSVSDLKLVAEAINAECDGQDGLVDGAVNNWRACRFDVGKLKCRPGRSACLTASQADVLGRVFAGAQDSRGRPLYSGFPWDPGLAAPGWRAWMIGDAPTAPGNAINATMALDAFANYFSTPAYSSPPDPSKIDFDQVEARVAEVGAINDATGTFMSSFVQRGGKLLVYHGLADPVFSASDTVDWFEKLQVTMGPTDSWSRLFLAPGMNHCVMGPATDRFDALEAIQIWVESNQAPDRLIATGSLAPGATAVERPLCPYPDYAHYTGGAPGAAASFACRRSQAASRSGSL